MYDKKIIDCIYVEWRKFISRKPIDENKIRPEIKAGWKRCIRMNIDPYGGACKVLLEGNALENHIHRNREFIQIARRFLDNLYSFLKGYGFFVMLTDPEGIILEFFGEDLMQEEAAQINYRKGACWAEEYVGSTTIGIVMNTRKPIQMTGAEHFCAKSHKWTCSASPVFDDHNNLIGIINVSGPRETAHKHTLGMVISSAESIHYLLTIQKQNRKLLRANDEMYSIFETISEALICLGNDYKIEKINNKALNIIKCDAIVGRDFREFIEGEEEVRKLLDESDFIFKDIEMIIKTKVGRMSCLVSSNPIKTKGERGRTVVIKPMDQVHNLVGKYVTSRAGLFFENILTKNPEMKNIIDIAKMAAEGDGNILLEGESGTGKEIFAQAIHNGSRRKKGAFIAVNCGAIPRELIGSELFGYVEGAFTGALKGGRPGKFEMASGGTIFLDEIGDMPLEQQVNLLRVLQERKVTRISGEKEIPVDVRIICASNKSLKDEIAVGNFRQDLFYRLNVIFIKIPPLRDRKEDIPLLFHYFMQSLCLKGSFNRKEVNNEFMMGLEKYDWPGNIRELQNIVERIMNTSREDCLTVKSLPEDILGINKNRNPLNLGDMEDSSKLVYNIRAQQRELSGKAEKKEIERLLLQNQGNVSEVARYLGVSRNTLYRKLKKYNMKE